MPSLSFTILPAGVAYLHDLLSCLAKFDENLSLEATPQELRISTLNVSKTAHASFTLKANSFFEKYQYSADTRSLGSKDRGWSCNLQNRAFAAVFRRRLADTRDRETGLERCDFKLQARQDQTQCRLIIQLVCKNGVTKTHRLYYESGEILHATFDRDGSSNFWTLSSRTLRDVVEYFGPKTDQLDWFFENGKITFTSYTEKVQNGKEILKQGMHTSVAIDRKDFEDFNVQQGLHIGITVKDFRAIVAHAETMRVNVTARYSRGNRPMQISYEDSGVKSDFTLMTRGTASNIPSNTPARDLSVRPVSQTPRERTPSGEYTTIQPGMPPPAVRNSFGEQSIQPALVKSNSDHSAPPPSASINPDSLFIPAEDDDHQWDEPDYDEEPDIVTWNHDSQFDSASSSKRKIRDSEVDSFASIPEPRRKEKDVYVIAPTQRLSQVRGMFD